jgi:hypothetical protein
MLTSCLLTAIGSLATAIGVLWRMNVALRQQLDALHATHLADVKELTQQALHVAEAVTYAPPLLHSRQPPPALRG